MKLKLHLLSLLTLAFLASCHVSNDVANGRLIQKRKYNNGFYTSFGKLFGRHGESQETATINALEKLEDGILSTPQIAENIGTESAAPLMGEDVAVIEVPVYEPVYEVVPVEELAEVSEEQVLTQSTDLAENNTGATTVGRVYKKHTIPTVLSGARAAAESGLMLVLLVILCFIIPPVAVAVVDGISQRFWIDLIFFIIGLGVGFWLLGGGLIYLCALVSVIYALLIVLGVI